MKKILLKGGLVFNEGRHDYLDILIEGDRITKIADNIHDPNAQEIDCEGKWIMPGIIDDQVHFREPGLTHKADINSESMAAVAGGVTSFMEMPNTQPPTITQERLEEKYTIGANTSLANFSFFMGATNDNLDEVLKTNAENVCGIKIFMGSSTGNMLVDNESTLASIFQNSNMLIATHCEDEHTIRNNEKIFRNILGEEIPFRLHPQIRSAEACYLSSSMAIDLAKRFDTRLHILHISTLQELGLFENVLPLRDKKITAEVCVHHMYFSDDQYDTLGSLIKCNPAIKGIDHRNALRKGLRDGILDIVATDHAPHTFAEKSGSYFKAPSGLPLIQHSLNMMREIFGTSEEDFSFIVSKMCHAPSECFRVRERGYLREGYYADIAVFDPNKNWAIQKDNIYYKCNWSPLEGAKMVGKVQHTFVSGNPVYQNEKINTEYRGKRLEFDRY